MPLLVQALPINHFCEDAGKFEKGKTAPYIKKKSEIDKTITQMIKTFGKKGLTELFLNEAFAQEYECVKQVYIEHEGVPAEFTASKVPSVRSLELNRPKFEEGKLSNYPTVPLSSIVDLADKLDMVVLPLDYVDLRALLKAHNIHATSDEEYRRQGFGFYAQSQYNFYQSILDCKVALDKIPYMESHMYILCPLSYYNIWAEVKADNVIPKYSPMSLDAVFTTIDLMLPTQRNLYAMVKTNETNVKSLSANFETNMQMIGDKLKHLESRMDKVEKQIEKILQTQKAQQAQLNEQAEKIRLQQAEIKELRYARIDPVIFYTHGKPVDFAKDALNSIKAHIVACFGPEFPADFFVMNGIQTFVDKPTYYPISYPDRVYNLNLGFNLV